MVLKNKKKHKKFHNNNVGARGDKISNLPDEILHHILSFLPTKYAMSTCILSKRWKYVSNSIPILKFRCWQTGKGTKKQKLLETKCFMNFLDTVLFLHERPSIQKFSLGLDDVSDEPRVNRWISTIMKHKIEEFCLYMNCSSTSSILPLSFFTCDSMTQLDLSFNMMRSGNLIIPNTVYFPKLKILKLSDVRFVDDSSTRKLFSNCLILEELRLSRCSLSVGLCIVNPALKHLFINYCWFPKSTLTISAPNLLTISYNLNRGAPPADFVLNSFPSLVEADIDLHMYGGFRYPSKLLVKLLEKFSSAKLLKICGKSFMVLREEEFILTGSLSFGNLIHMEIRFGYRYQGIGSDPSPTVRTFLRFLQLFPNLKSIIFTQSMHIPEEEDEGCWPGDPKYPVPQLKLIKFKNFEAEPMEINAIKLFLKYARVLETLTIVAHPRPQKDHKEVAELLLKLPKPAGCVVKFLMSSEDTSQCFQLV